jgi:hypothetical protein
MALAGAGASSISVTGMLCSNLKGTQANNHQFVSDLSQFEKLHRCKTSEGDESHDTHKKQNQMR